MSYSKDIKQEPKEEKKNQKIIKKVLAQFYYFMFHFKNDQLMNLQIKILY